jgi:hypothetical protein
VAAAVLPWYAAVMLTVVCECTALVVMLTLGEVFAPAATVTVAGTAATAESELDNEMVKPPVGAAAFKVTLSVMVLPPTTLDCPRVTVAGARGFTVRVVDTVLPL